VQPKVITALWHRVVDRPLVRALAVVAAFDWTATTLLGLVGRFPMLAALSFVVVSAIWWVIVLTWYRALPGLLVGPSRVGVRGAQVGQFFEQMGLGLLAGMHAVWTVWVVVLTF
jgi:hypothetical protein